ncbi:hypothetical protein EHM69_03710 [candidate division KSB1 bacterium]|nr:MAG: hypothetical protein EHM69_03710 [candidate division KSB1 bacterium]
MPYTLLIIGGILNALLVVFHIMFWKIFDWPNGLASLSADNRAIIQVLNIGVIFGLAVFAVLSIVFRREMLDTRLGRFVTAAIAGFYILRAVCQLMFWGSGTESVIAFVVLLLIAFLYDVAFHLTKPIRK